MTSLFHDSDIPCWLLEISSDSDFLKGAVIAKIMVMFGVSLFQP